MNPNFDIPVLIVVIAMLSLVFTYFIAKYTIVKSKCEGDFRYAHVRVREFAESIGFHGEKVCHLGPKWLFRNN